VPAQVSVEDELAVRRLTGLLDYVEALVKLDERVATRLSQHKLADGSQFALYQHEIAGLPAIQCDSTDADGPIWLRVQRLQRTTPPVFDGAGKKWIDVSNDPLRVPVIHEALHIRVSEVEQQRLVTAGQARPEDCVESLRTEKSDTPNQKFYDVMLRLEDRPAIRNVLEAYCSGPWSHWSELEKPRRRSIAVYQRLFEIAQRLLQSGGSESIELVWGIGLARWKHLAEFIDLPMIECGVEIEIAETGNADITVRPRSGVTRVELRPFEKLAGARFVLAEDAARRCLRSLEGPDSEGISPFRAETFEPILKICGGQLDPEGRFLPDHRALPASEPVPEPEGEFLTVSDRYVLYARRRSNNSVLRDIERLKKEVSSEDGKPIKIEGATRTLVLGPSDGIDDTFKPLGDRLGAVDQIELAKDDAPVDPDHGDLFFPKPFNDEQVEIIRRLEKSDGLVVQGPPGTGKTHTIANIISHMLATGRRVLVVSHGETALRVIQDQLPEGVRDLAISVTTSEREGMKQVEKAVGLMLGVVNTIDMNRSRQVKIIRDLEAKILADRNRLGEIDVRLAKIATQHLSPIPGSSELPFEAAKRVIEDKARYTWFSDRPVRSFSETDMTPADIDALFAARRTVKGDLKYIGERFPSPANMPDPETVRAWHLDLIAAQDLTADSVASEPLTRRAIATLGIDKTAVLSEGLRRLASGMTFLQEQSWAWALTEALLGKTALAGRLEPLARAFLLDAQALVAQRAPFIARPIQLPKELPPAKQLFQILATLSAGKNAFGMMAFGAKSHQPVFEAVRVAGLRPSTPNDWQHVQLFIDFCGAVTSLSARWDTLKVELSAPNDLSFAVESLFLLDALSDTLHACLTGVPGQMAEMSKQLSAALGNTEEASAILRHPAATTAFAQALSRHVSSIRLAAVAKNVADAVAQFDGSNTDLAGFARQILTELVGKPNADIERLTRVWQGILSKLGHVRALEPSFDRITNACGGLSKAGVPAWAERLRSEPASEETDPAVPNDWREAWEWAARLTYLEKIGASSHLAQLHQERLEIEKALRDGFAALVKERTFFNLAATMKGSAKSALQGFANIIRRLGAGTGQRAVLHRQNARLAMQNCYEAVPCWIMPTWRVSEQLPATLASFDLVILDEASQSDARELPALLRGKKVLVVGDDRQVSPSAAFLSIANIARLRQNFLSEFPFRAEVEPGASIYDLARVMFPAKFVMLKEHFRCVEPIIRFSMQFYSQDLVPLRIPKPSERLDPPLIDIYVEDGQRRGKSKVNPREAEVIVDEIAAIVEQASSVEGPARSIGVISLIGADQALHVQKLLMERIGEAAMVRHRVVCGDSATLQGDERDIVFISMIADRARKQSQTSTQYQQRFNVALSRARDRMVLVRSVKEEELNPKDLKSKVIGHFREPMPNVVNPSAELVDLCQSEFERAVFMALIERGYRVIPQVGAVGFSIDMVVEGEGGRRLAVECDGDRYHGPERWADDMRRQRILERVGWSFWRCFGSNYQIDQQGVMDDLIQTLDRMQIKPIGLEPANRRYSEHRVAAVAAETLDNTGVDHVDGAISVASLRAELDPASNNTEKEYQLVPGDRVVIRYLDAEPSRPEFLIMSDISDDPMNGYLLLSSPLGQALSQGSPGDELSFQVGDRERAVLFVSLETVSAQAA
jgi:very-short-patch-repair endonuclease/transcription elongation GreA/GreB family factor